MGIRVYIRNSKDTESENEICLGKLYAYADGNENLESVKYMIETRCFTPEYWGYFFTYHDNGNDLYEHLDCLMCGGYFDYGEIAQFNDMQIFDFVMLFSNDWNLFWVNENPNCNFNVRNIFDCILAQNKKYNNCIWELRQGA